MAHDPHSPGHAPFEVGDIVKMIADGYNIPVGTEAEVTEVNYNTFYGYWWIRVRSKHGVSGKMRTNTYNVKRFIKVGKAEGAKPMRYAIFEADKDSGDPTGDPTFFTGTADDASEVVRGLLKANPEKEYIFGPLKTHAKVDAPPVKFTNL